MSEPLDLEQIKSREKAAWHGPWGLWGSFDREDGNRHVSTDESKSGGTYYYICRPPKLHWPKDMSLRGNFEFIAHAREDIPALIKEVERLREIEWRMKGLEK